MAFWNIFLEDLQHLEQTSTVEEFHQHFEFEAIRTLVAYAEPGIPEANFVALFVRGLHTEVQAYVEGFLPFTILDAYYLACLFVNGYSRVYQHQDENAEVVAGTATNSSLVVATGNVHDVAAEVKLVPQLQAVPIARCDGQDAILNLILGAVPTSGLDPSLCDDDAEEVTESARVCADRNVPCGHNDISAVNFDCSSGPVPTAGMVSYYASVCNLHKSIVASVDVSIGKATDVYEVIAHTLIPVVLRSAASACTFNTTAIVISSNEGQEAQIFLHNNMKDLTDIVSLVVCNWCFRSLPHVMIRLRGVSLQMSFLMAIGENHEKYGTAMASFHQSYASLLVKISHVYKGAIHFQSLVKIPFAVSETILYDPQFSELFNILDKGDMIVLDINVLPPAILRVLIQKFNSDITPAASIVADFASGLLEYICKASPAFYCHELQALPTRWHIYHSDIMDNTAPGAVLFSLRKLYFHVYDFVWMSQADSALNILSLDCDVACLGLFHEIAYNCVLQLISPPNCLGVLSALLLYLEQLLLMPQMEAGLGQCQIETVLCNFADVLSRTSLVRWLYDPGAAWVAVLVALVQNWVFSEDTIGSVKFDPSHLLKYVQSAEWLYQIMLRRNHTVSVGIDGSLVHVVVAAYSLSDTNEQTGFDGDAYYMIVNCSYLGFFFVLDLPPTTGAFVSCLVVTMSSTNLVHRLFRQVISRHITSRSAMLKGQIQCTEFWPYGITDQQQKFLWQLVVRHIYRGSVTARRIDIGINQIEASMYSPLAKWIGYVLYKNISLGFTLIFGAQISPSSQSVYHVLDQALTIFSTEIADIAISSIDIFPPAGYSNVFKQWGDNAALVIVWLALFNLLGVQLDILTTAAVGNFAILNALSFRQSKFLLPCSGLLDFSCLLLHYSFELPRMLATSVTTCISIFGIGSEVILCMVGVPSMSWKYICSVLSIYKLALLVCDFVHEFEHSPIPLCDQGLCPRCHVTTGLLFISPVGQYSHGFNADSQGIGRRFILLPACSVLIMHMVLSALSNHTPCVDSVLVVAGMNTWLAVIGIFHIDSLADLEILSPMPSVLMSVAYRTAMPITGAEMTGHTIRLRIQIVAMLDDLAKKSPISLCFYFDTVVVSTLLVNQR